MACQRNGVQALCGRYGRRATREMTRERCQWDSKRYRPGLPHPRRPWSRDRCPFTHQAKHFERAPEIEAAALRGESPAIYARGGLWARALPGLYAIQGSPPAPANLGLHVQRGGRPRGWDSLREVDACFFLLHRSRITRLRSGTLCLRPVYKGSDGIAE